ncbi:MAG: hypothetical protein ACI92S_002901, partial [Planctomycetaceae bacterium]
SVLNLFIALLLVRDSPRTFVVGLRQFSISPLPLAGEVGLSGPGEGFGFKRLAI